MRKKLKISTLALGTALALTMTAAQANTGDKVLSLQSIDAQNILHNDSGHKCGEGKCGANKKKDSGDKKCGGDHKCGAKK